MGSRLVCPVGAERARGDVFRIGGQHHGSIQRHDGSTGHGNCHIFGTLTGYRHGRGVRARSRRGVGHRDGGAILGLGDGHGGGSNGEHTAFVGQRHSHFTRQVSAQNVEGGRYGLAYVGGHGQRFRIGNQLGSGNNGGFLQSYLLDVALGIGTIDIVGHHIELIGSTGGQIVDRVVLGSNARDDAAVLVTSLVHRLGGRAVIDAHTIEIVALAAARAGDDHILASGCGHATQCHGVVGSSIGQRHGLAYLATGNGECSHICTVILAVEDNGNRAATVAQVKLRTGQRAAIARVTELEAATTCLVDIRACPAGIVAVGVQRRLDAGRTVIGRGHATEGLNQQSFTRAAHLVDIQGVVSHILGRCRIGPGCSERGRAHVGGRRHHGSRRLHDGRTVQSHGHILGAPASNRHRRIVGASPCRCVGYRHSSAILGVGFADCGGIDAENTIGIGERQRHIARQVSAQDVEGCRGGLAHVGGHCQRLRIGNQLGSGG